MKRLFVLFAFLLLSCAFHAQDVKAQTEGTLLIAPRIDVEPYYSFDDHSWSASLGSTSFYTFFDGSLGEHLSFSFGNHWLAFSDFSFDDTRALYQNTWRTEFTNWVDWANVTVNFSGFFLTLGKDYLRIGTNEIEEYDYLSHWQINSAFWNNYQVYQWGGRVGWMSEEEDTMVSLAVTTDMNMIKPFHAHSFDEYAFTLSGMHDFENVVLLASVSHCNIGWLGAAGLKINFNDAISMNLDGYGSGEYAGGALQLTAGLGEKLDLLAKVGYDHGNSAVMDFWGSRFYSGAGCYWYPLRDNRDLRVHGLASYDSYDHTFGMSFGLTYSLNLNLF